MKKPRLMILCLLLLIILVFALPLESLAALGDTTLVSRSTGGVQADGSSFDAAVSADGRYVAFGSYASNLVSGDTNGFADVFMRDTQSGTTTRVSVATGGGQAHGDSFRPALSYDGRYVAFYSNAPDLVSGDINGYIDVFVHDTLSNTTIRVSVATDGSQGDHDSQDPVISADGRYVAFHSYASNLVSGDTNGYADIFVRDTQSSTTTRLSLATDGTQGNGHSRSPAITADGRYIAFHSYASNLVSGDTNATSDVFLRDTQSDSTSLLSVATGGSQGDGTSQYPTISADGRYVAFESTASNLVSGDLNGLWNVFLRDTQSGTTTCLSQAMNGMDGNHHSYWPSISGDGRYVVFYSYASNLVGWDTNGYGDVFLRDTQRGTTERLSVSTQGTQGNEVSYYPALSADGHFAAFLSKATNLVDSDANQLQDIFLHEINPDHTWPEVLVRLVRFPASILRGSVPSGSNQWFARVSLNDNWGAPGQAFHFVAWLHVPDDWTLPWATQYSFSGDFTNTPLSPDWDAQAWVQDLFNCPLGGSAEAGFKWRAFRGPEEALPGLGSRVGNRVNLRGGLGVPSGVIPDVYGGVRVIVGSYYDYDLDGAPDRYRCDHAAGTAIEVP